MVGRRLLLWLAAVALAGSGCTSGDGSDSSGRASGGSGGGGGGGGQPGQQVAVDPPREGECRVLVPADVDAPSNDSPVVDCEEPHTAETFLVGALEGEVAKATWNDPALGAAVYDRCQRRWARFVGADESLALRTLLDWAWFRPSEEQWDAGARWFRCDVVGRAESADRLPALPETAKGALLGRPDDRWMACVDGGTVDAAPWVPCASPHTWRAVTTVVVGDRSERYPGDRLIEVTSRDFCRASVLAWLDYPLDYEFGYTRFHRPEWELGSRRSICWARTDR